MEYEEFRRLVIERAFARLSSMRHPAWRGKVCTDMVFDQFEIGASIDIAVERVVDDTLYWDGAFC